MGGASVALDGAWSMFGNQAGIAEITKPEFGLTVMNLYLVKELSTRSVIAVLPWQGSVFGISYSQFGVSYFRRNNYDFTYARKISQKFNFGVQFNLHSVYFPEDNKSEFTHGLQIGVQLKANEDVVFGFHLVNPYKTSIKTYSGQYSIPSYFRFGFSNRMSQYFVFVSEFESDFYRHNLLKVGFESNIFQKIYFRTGLTYKPYSLNAGIAYKVKWLTADLSYTWSQNLGTSPSISLLFGL